MGYYGLFIGLEYRNTQEMIQKLDSENYTDSETITLKIPVAIPYSFDSPAFERVNGQFQYKGEFYRLVKQRLLSDTLLIVCVKDQQSKHIQQALTSYVTTFTDKPVDNHTNTKSFSDFGKDYFSPVFSIDHLAFGWGRDIPQESPVRIFNSSFYPSIIHPPERLFSI